MKTSTEQIMLKWLDKKAIEAERCMKDAESDGNSDYAYEWGAFEAYVNAIKFLTTLIEKETAVE